MNAWRDCTNSSKPKIAMLQIHATTPASLFTIDSLSSSRYSPPSTKTSTSRWPANMLAKSRRESVIGRTMMLEKNSSGMMIGHMNHGTPDGNVACFR